MVYTYYLQSHYVELRNNLPPQLFEQICLIELFSLR